MADEKPKPLHSERPLFLQPWPGYWATKRKLERLRRFQNLIRHRERWAPDMAFACPIEGLVPPSIPEGDRYYYIEQEIYRLMRIVHRDLNFAGVPTGIYYKHWDPVEQKDEREDYDTILDYFRLPREQSARQAFEAVMGVLEQGVGIYAARLSQARWELFNPITWAAYAVRIPITIMERAGLVGHEKTTEMVLGGYARVMKFLMIAILCLILILLGAKVPWKEIITGLVNLLLK
jgi:hypothetical protein